MDGLKEPLGPQAKAPYAPERSGEAEPASYRPPGRSSAPHLGEGGSLPPERTHRSSRVPYQPFGDGPDDGFDWEDPAPRRRGWRLLLLAFVVAGFAVLVAQLTADLGALAPFERVAGRFAPIDAPLPSSDPPGLGAAVGLGKQSDPATMPPLQSEEATRHAALHSETDARADPVVPAPTAQRFLVPADEVLGYAQGRGLSSLAYGLLEGTHCKLEIGATVVWHRDQPGGAECRVLLFDRGGLRSGWRIPRLLLRLGYGTAVFMGGEEASVSSDGRANSAVLDLSAHYLPAQFRVQGKIPLPGAHFWVALDQIELEGPPGATDWHEAFVRGIAPLE